MLKRLKKTFKKFFFITDKKLVNEEDLKSKILEELILLKDEEHDFLAINIPVIISCLGVIVSIILSVNPKIGEEYPRVPSYLSLTLILLIVRLAVISRNILKERDIRQKNEKIYDKEIFKRLKEYKKADDKFKNQVINCLEEIQQKFN